MNIKDANLILNRLKEGDVYSIFTINKALFITGDLPDDPDPSNTHGKATWVEGTRMDESETA